MLGSMRIPSIPCALRRRGVRLGEADILQIRGGSMTSATDVTPDQFYDKAAAWLVANAVRVGESTAYEAAALGTGQGQKDYLAKFYRAGFAGITWPSEYGGQGLSDEHQLAFNRASNGY